MRYLFLIFSFSVFACTDFVVKGADGTLVNGRSLEFAQDFHSEIQINPRKMEVSSMAPDGSVGMRWVSKYGFLGVNLFGKSLSLDGMNEKGLSAGLLWMPTTEYQCAESGKKEKPLDFADLIAWILGNFASVAEVKQALQELRVWGHPIPPIPGVPPIHAAIHDAMGNHLVVEFLKGEMRVYDNPNTVLTNYPPFDWMLINLQNYIHLSAFNATPQKFAGTIFEQTGQGSGMLGIPGDSTPPSRFVRISTYLQFVNPPQNPREAVNLAEHLLNTFDIPKGVIRDKTKQGVNEDFTQWIVIKDQTNRIFYFRSYKNLSLKSIDMKKISFEPGSSGSIEIDLSTAPIDVTGSLTDHIPSTN